MTSEVPSHLHYDCDSPSPLPSLTPANPWAHLSSYSPYHSTTFRHHAQTAERQLKGGSQSSHSHLQELSAAVSSPWAQRQLREAGPAPGSRPCICPMLQLALCRLILAGESLLENRESWTPRRKASDRPEPLNTLSLRWHPEWMRQSCGMWLCCGARPAELSFVLLVHRAGSGFPWWSRRDPCTLRMEPEFCGTAKPTAVASCHRDLSYHLPMHKLEHHCSSCGVQGAIQGRESDASAPAWGTRLDKLWPWCSWRSTRLHGKLCASELWTLPHPGHGPRPEVLSTEWQPHPSFHRFLVWIPAPFLMYFWMDISFGTIHLPWHPNCAKGSWWGHQPQGEGAGLPWQGVHHYDSFHPRPHFLCVHHLTCSEDLLCLRQVS